MSIHLNIDPQYIAPPPDKSLLETCDFVLIRHAVTDFNIEWARVVGTYGYNSQEYRELKVDPTFIDMPIKSPEGILQCEAAH